MNNVSNVQENEENFSCNPQLTSDSCRAKSKLLYCSEDSQTLNPR